MLDTTDLSACLRYRIAYGEAARLSTRSQAEGDICSEASQVR
jgi:hypothetical protein